MQYYDYSFVLPASSQLCNLILMCSIIYIEFVNNAFQGLLIKDQPFLFAYQCLVQQPMVNRYTIMNTILSIGFDVVLAMMHAIKLAHTQSIIHYHIKQYLEYIGQ